MDVSVIIVSYNTCSLIRQCIDSIRRQTAATTSYEIIEVDNASVDGSVAMLRSEYPDICVLALPMNEGFGRACNRGAELAHGNAICLLNPDAELMGDTLSALVTFAADNPTAGIFGGRSIHRDGTLDPRSCWAVPTVWSQLCFATGLSSLFSRTRLFDPESMGNWQRDHIRNVDVVTGYLLLTPAAVWKELGGFDERFFLYGEDLDLCRRARLLGYSPMITPDAVVAHLGGASSVDHTSKRTLLMQGKATYIRKHWHGLRKSIGIGALWTGVGLRALKPGDTSWRRTWKARKMWLGGYS